MSSTQEPPEIPMTHAVDGLEDPFEGSSTPLHMSCSACKHYHRHRPLKIPSENSEHVRVTCERCGHPMFGLGRTSTQTTLASRESIPISVSGRVPPSNLRVCTNSLDKSPVEHSTQTDAPGHLTPLTEQSPLPRSSLSSQSPLEAQEGRQNDEDLQIAQREDKATTSGQNVKGVLDPLERFKHKHHPHRRFFQLRFQSLRELGRRLGNRLRGKPLSSYPPSRTPDAQYKVTQEGTSHAIIAPSGTVRPSSTAESSHHVISLPCGSTNVERCREIEGPQEMEMIPSRTTPAEESNLKPLSPDSQLLEDSNVNDTLPKGERLRRFRRERTLRHNAMYEQICRCGGDCECKLNINGGGGNSEPGNGTLEGISIQAVPDYVLDRVTRSNSDSHVSLGRRSLLARHIGQQFNPNWRSSSDAELSISIADSAPTSERFSQAPTHIGSDESTASTSSHRGSSPRRRSSDNPSSAFRVHRSPAVRALHDITSVSGNHRGEIIRAESSPRFTNTITSSLPQSRPSSSNSEALPHTPQANAPDLHYDVRTLENHQAILNLDTSNTLVPDGHTPDEVPEQVTPTPLNAAQVLPEPPTQRHAQLLVRFQRIADADGADERPGEGNVPEPG